MTKSRFSIKNSRDIHIEDSVYQYFVEPNS